MALGLGISLSTTASVPAMTLSRWKDFLTDSDSNVISNSRGQPIEMARPSGAWLLTNSRGQVITNTQGSAIYGV